MAKIDIKEMQNFFADKQQITDLIQNKKKDQASLLLDKWKAHPSFYRILHQQIKDIENIDISNIDIKKIDLIPSSQQPHQKIIEPFLSKFTPSPQSIHSFFQSQHIIGEEHNQELLIYALLSRTNIGIESLPGSGKSALLYAAVNALPPPTYHLIHQATAKSLYNNQNINQSEFWIIPELQKIFTPDIKELIKNLTEGKSAQYTKTNPQQNGITSKTIEKKCIIYTLAITNNQLKQRDDELLRRFLILHTDISREKNKRIAAHFGQQEMQTQENHPKNKLFQQHLAQKLSYTAEIKNPFRQYLNTHLPSHIIGATQFPSQQHYLNNLIKGLTVFQNTAIPPSAPYLFSSLNDNQHLPSIYHPTLLANLYNLSVIDNTFLHLVPEQPAPLNTLKDQWYEKYTPSLPLDDSISKLCAANLIEKTNNTHLSLKISLEITLNTEESLEHATELMKQNFPKYHDQWYSKLRYL